VAGLNQKPHVSIHETRFHCHVLSVRKHSALIQTSLLDEAEDVIPSSAVQAARVMAKLEQNLLHLESSGECLNQDGAADGSKWNPEVVLGKVENIVPKASFTVVLHLREVEVRTAAASKELFCIVEEVEGKVENGAAHGLIVNGHTRFIKMPSSRAVLKQLVAAADSEVSLRTER
jgi:hypothetical protein